MYVRGKKWSAGGLGHFQHSWRWFIWDPLLPDLVLGAALGTKFPVSLQKGRTPPDHWGLPNVDSSVPSPVPAVAPESLQTCHAKFSGPSLVCTFGSGRGSASLGAAEHSFPEPESVLFLRESPE